MKRILTILALVIGINASLSAQNTVFLSEVCYEHLFLEADNGLKSSWGMGVPQIGVDYHVMDMAYVGASIGASFGNVDYDFGKAGRTYSNIYDLRIPMRAGISLLDRNLKLDTGPFLNFTVGGESTYYTGKTETTTKFKDMDFSRVSLGWSINLRLFELFKIGYSFMLTDSAYGEGGDAGFLSIGLSLALEME